MSEKVRKNGRARLKSPPLSLTQPPPATSRQQKTPASFPARVFVISCFAFASLLRSESADCEPRQLGETPHFIGAGRAHLFHR